MRFSVAASARLITVFVLLTVASGCSALKNPSALVLPDQQGRIVPKGAQINTDVLPVFQNALASRTGMRLLEGLPNENSEAKLYQAEKKANKTVKRAGFLFYPAPITPSPADEQALVAALSQPGAVAEFSGAMKMCGGFHPDFAILWNDASGAAYEAQICFGCEEIKLFGPQNELYADLAPETFSALREVLRYLGKNAVPRP